MPRWLATTHAVRQTPIAAVALLSAIGIVGGISLGVLLTPIGAFGFLGTLDAVFVLLIYVLVSVACPLFFWRKRRAQFRLVRHGLIPLLGLLITGGISVLALLSPGDGALAYIPAIVGGWLLLGVVALLVMGRRIVPAAPPA